MFCTQCGSQVGDDAQFCSVCGAKVVRVRMPNAQQMPGAPQAPNAPQAPYAQQAPNDRQASNGIGSSFASKMPSGAAVVSGLSQKVSDLKGSGLKGSGLKLSSLNLAATIVTLCALVFSLFSWFELSAQMNMVSGLASGVSSYLGASPGAYAFDDSYPVWGLVGLAGTFNDYVQTYSALGGTRGASQAMGASLLVTLFAWVCLLLWLATLAFSIWGAITTFRKGETRFIYVANTAMIFTVIVFYIFAASMTSGTGTATGMPLLCLVLAIASLICLRVAKSNAQAS